MKALIIENNDTEKLNSLTCNLPFSILQIVNKPLFFIQLEWLKRNNITDIIFSTSKEELKDCFPECSLNLIFSKKSQGIGSAGALKKASRYFEGEDIVVLKDNILTDINLSEMIHFHNKNSSNFTVASTMKFNKKNDMIEFNENNEIISYIDQKDETEKNNIINTNLYIINSDIINKIPENIEYSLEKDLLKKMIIEKEKVYSYFTVEYWNKIDSLEKYLKIHHDILKERLITRIYAEKKGDVFVGDNAEFITPVEVNGQLLIGANCVINKNASLDEYTIIGKDCEINSKSYISNSIIHNNVKIGKNVEIRNCIIGSNCIIEDNVKIIPSSNVKVISENSRITKFSIV